jgi:hypothetical protein
MLKLLKKQLITRIFFPITIAVFFSSSCSNSKEDARKALAAAMKAYEDYNLPATLPETRSNVRVKVSLSNRMAYVMEGAKPLLVMPVTVGRSSAQTPTGNFKIRAKNHDYRANTHGYRIKGDIVRWCYLRNKPAGWIFKGTPMPYWCEFKSAYGFHTGWMKPFPASGGCLRMHKNVAPKFFRLVSVGTPVSIAQTQSEDATIGQDIPRPPDATPFPGNPIGMMALTDKFFTMHSTPTYLDQKAQLPESVLPEN